ncbi:MAG: hypothetical protein GSR72_07735 [Desulfurococcales archaeon]|nr:hypothetical protein [Desulfurococcales archaeon]MEB3789763.1 hypothetical protein [Desulfurococcales archaeon]
MDSQTFILLSAVIAYSGAFTSLYISLSLFKLGEVIKDKGLTLSAIAMTIFGISLLIEATVNIMAPTYISGPGRRPQELLSILVNRGTLIAIPLYTISYVLMASSHYVSGVSLRETAIPPKEFSVIPLFVIMFIDYNVIDLIVLIVAAIIVLGKYGSARLPTVVFYIVLGISHLVPVMLLFASSSWWIVPLSTLLRGLAPLILFASSLLKE